MYTTREYTLLKGDGCDDVTIKPNTEFKAFEGDYTVTCYANIKNTETDEVIILKPGDKIKGISKVIKLDKAPTATQIKKEQEEHDKRSIDMHSVELDKSVEEFVQKAEEFLKKEAVKPKPRRKRKVSND